MPIHGSSPVSLRKHQRSTRSPKTANRNLASKQARNHNQAPEGVLCVCWINKLWRSAIRKSMYIFWKTACSTTEGSGAWSINYTKKCIFCLRWCITPTSNCRVIDCITLLIFFYCNFTIYNVTYYNCIYKCLPEDEHSGSKHVEEVKKKLKIYVLI